MRVTWMKAVVNPASAGGSTRLIWPKMKQAAADLGIMFDPVFTTCPDHATELTREALLAGHEQVVAVGGDGTIHEVVNGFFQGDNPINPAAALGIIARGTGCDLIKTLGIPKPYEQALHVLQGQQIKTIDLCRCEFVQHNGVTERRYFVNVGGVGISGATVQRVNRSSKRFGGRFSFMSGALRTLFTYEGTQLEVVIDDRETLTGRFHGVIVANGKFFGGGMQIAPDAALDDGEFTVVLLGDLTRLEALGSFARIYQGTHGAHPKVQMYSAKRVLVRTTEQCLLDLDGEQPGRANALFTLLPGALRVIC